MNHLSTSPFNKMFFCSLDDIRFFFDVKMVKWMGRDRNEIDLLFAEELHNLQNLSGIAMAVSEPVTAISSSGYITEYIQILLSDGQTRWIYFNRFCSSKRLLIAKDDLDKAFDQFEDE